MKVDRFRVKPNSKVDLKDYDPDDRNASSGSKSANVVKLASMSEELDQLQDVFFAARSHKLLIVLQGMDTSGKDGTVRQVFSSVDPLGVRVVSFKAPTQEELDHDFLWRVHSRVPGKGEIGIFNRSHYEDVLITRVHDWISTEECQRRYQQINAFERLLAETGTIVLKFFLHISKDEQRERLEARLKEAKKAWKFNPTDLEERKLWSAYMRAYERALSETSTEYAPWYIVPSNSKMNRNLFVCTVIIDALERLKLRYPPLSRGLSGLKVR